MSLENPQSGQTAQEREVVKSIGLLPEDFRIYAEQILTSYYQETDDSLKEPRLSNLGAFIEIIRSIPDLSGDVLIEIQGVLRNIAGTADVGTQKNKIDQRAPGIIKATLKKYGVSIAITSELASPKPQSTTSTGNNYTIQLVSEAHPTHYFESVYNSSNPILGVEIIDNQILNGGHVIRIRLTLKEGSNSQWKLLVPPNKKKLVAFEMDDFELIESEEQQRKLPVIKLFEIPLTNGIENIVDEIEKFLLKKDAIDQVSYFARHHNRSIHGLKESNNLAYREIARFEYMSSPGNPIEVIEVDNIYAQMQIWTIQTKSQNEFSFQLFCEVFQDSGSLHANLYDPVNKITSGEVFFSIAAREIGQVFINHPEYLSRALYDALCGIDDSNFIAVEKSKALREMIRRRASDLDAPQA